MNNPLEERLAAVRQVKQHGTARTPASQPVASAPAPRPRARRAGRRVGERWEDRVSRATFHIDRDLLDALPAVAERAGMSKSEFVREALRRAIQDVARDE